MTKDGVRDFIAAEYTLSENYVHGLAAFGPRLKNFESPHSSRGSSPGLPAGNSVSSATPFLWHITSIAELAQKSGCEKAEDLLWLLRLVAAPED